MHPFSTLAKLSLCASLTIFTAACDSDKESTNNTNSQTPDAIETQVVDTPKVEAIKLRPLTEAKGEALVQAAYLRGRLTESTFAYVRVPNLWSFIGTPKGNIYDTALSTKPFVDATKGIKEGFAENVIPDLPAETHSFVRLMTATLTSPIEIAAIKVANPDVPVPNVLLSAGVNFESIEPIQALLTEFSATSNKIEITKAVNPAGYAELDIDGSTMQILWDKSLSRLFILGGADLQAGSLDSLIKSLVSNETHPMLAVEKTIDDSGQGLFAWINPKSFSDISKAMGRQQEYAAMAMTGLGSMKNIAVGIGSSNGINRLKFVIDMPVFGFRAYLPAIKTSPTFNLAGKTDLVAVLGMPSKKNILALEQLMTMGMSPDIQEGYQTSKNKFSEVMGFKVEEIFAMFGQDISLVSGEVGMHLALRLNDKAAFKQMLDNSIKAFNLSYEQRIINGHTYHHLQIPPLDISDFDELLADSENETALKFIQRIINTPGHLYWEQEGDYLITASIPQILIDRHYVTNVPVNEWLEKEQRIDSKGSLFMLSLRNEGSAAMMYRLQIGLLSYLGDVVERPVDLFSLPTPKEANLPTSGSTAIKITSSDTQVAFELAYEHNPLELLFTTSGYMSVMAVGIMSSVAIPAYQDYTIRAQLNEGLIATSSMKIAIDQFKLEHSRYPSASEISQLNLSQLTPSYIISVTANTGEVVVIFTHQVLGLTSNTLTMSPPTGDNSTGWTCKSTIQNKYLPSSCRDYNNDYR